MDKGAIITAIISVCVVAVGGIVSFAILTTGDVASVTEEIERTRGCARVIINNHADRMDRIQDRLERLESFHIRLGDPPEPPTPVPTAFPPDISRIRASQFFHPTSWKPLLYPDRTISFLDEGPFCPVLCGNTGRLLFPGTKV